MSSDIILVIGTTPDYVTRLNESHAGKLCFAMHYSFEREFDLESGKPCHLYFTDIENHHVLLEKTERYLKKHKLIPQGIACFDCESLMAASLLARSLNLFFASPESISLCRNKFLSKQLWLRHNVPAPEATMASNLSQTIDFFRKNGNQNIVIKPVSASGSELVFKCRNELQISEAVEVMTAELSRRKDKRLFNGCTVFPDDRDVDPCGFWVAETCINGREFSCDFILDQERVHLIRETAKVMAPNQTFGSVLAYVYPPSYPENFLKDEFKKTLKNAAYALGFDRGYFMADFIVDRDRPMILELTPRPGGDSIPDLIETAAGIDIPGLYLSYVRKDLKLPVSFPRSASSFAAINLYAPAEGLIKYLSAQRMKLLPWVKSVRLLRETGDIVCFPPEDYDSRLLGYCIVESRYDTDDETDPFSLSRIIFDHLIFSISKSTQWTISQDAYY